MGILFYRLYLIRYVKFKELKSFFGLKILKCLFENIRIYSNEFRMTRLLFCGLMALNFGLWRLKMNTVVNSWNEWDPLKHVIVGRADDCHIPLKPHWMLKSQKIVTCRSMRRRPQNIDRANELLDNFASLLEKRE